MNHETELKIQAYLDEELSAVEVPKIRDLVNQDMDARTLFEILARTRGVLAENEPEHKLPEAREFYWSKIERAITVPTPTKPVRTFALGWTSAWRRFAVSFAGVALLSVLIISGQRFSNGLHARHAQEVETPLEEVSAITFQSESANMTVVWVQSEDN